MDALVNTHRSHRNIIGVHCYYIYIYIITVIAKNITITMD